MEEIKQGDKVRVSKDAPLLYTEGRIDWEAVESTVDRIDGDAVKIDYINEDDDELYSIAIPTKYLIKVDTEAKEAKYKVGNWVMISGVFNPQVNGMIGWISRIDKDGYKVSFQDGRFAIVEDKYLTLITQPTEQTEENQAFTLGDKVVTPYGYGVVGKDFEGRIAVALENGGFCDINKAVKIIADNPVFDWDAYAADLAKELALKVANKYNAPEQAAEYAVSVAKAVVEGLKRSDMKLKDLLNGRDKLRKYDELEKWREWFDSDTICVTNRPPGIERLGYVTVDYLTLIHDHIKQIIIDALDSEMEKMEEE